ncbi:MAG: rod shape-determining protein MreD [Treponema sp.]|jgi:rod shape-determining protein MreD|nr:rod shape-determining protein MreD [Treponema sp.]
MAKNVGWAAVFSLAAALLQSTLFRRIAPYHTVPDLALGILVYSAYVNGIMTGQVTGFFSGLILDFISNAPLGLHCLLRTIIGASVGLLKGTFFLDAFFLPMALCATATLSKALMLFLLHLLLAGAVPYYPLVSPTLWIELMFNSLSAPLLFGLLKLFQPLLVGKAASDASR